MKLKDFLRKAFMLRSLSEKLKVCRHGDGAGLMAVNLRKTYFSPVSHASAIELVFITDQNAFYRIWTLEELTAALLNLDQDAEMNVDKCEFGGNATEKWIEV